VKYNGYAYATMDKCNPNSKYGACKATCQNGYVAMPAGWELVPYSDALVKNVVMQAHWGTHVVVFSNGHGYGGKSYNNGVLWNKNMLSSSGNSHKTNSCSLKVLMRSSCGVSGGNANLGGVPHVAYNGYAYATMDKCSPNAPTALAVLLARTATFLCRLAGVLFLTATRS